MSRAFYKSKVAPSLLHTCVVGKGVNSYAIEVWNTTCIVTNFGKTSHAPKCTVLINPGNPELSGVSKFPYFPRGGPVPKDSFSGFSSHRKWQPLGYVSQWGGMEIGSEMLYPVSVVDGMVHQLGGWPLRFEIQQLQVHGLEKGIKCPIGEAVVTSSCNRFLKRSSKLYKEYSYIVHTSPPFYNHSSTGDPFKLLRLCYRNSLSAAFDLTDSISTTGRVAIAVPLLGAGARGFPLETALEIAASETLSWCRENSEQSVKHTQLCIAFGIPDKDTAELLSSKLKLKMFEKL